MDLKASALEGFKRAATNFTKDLEALPEEAFSLSQGGKARTVSDLVYEVNLVNDHVGMVLRGEEPFPWPEGGWIVAPNDFTGKEATISAFRKSSARILETIEAFGEGEMDATVETEHGPSTRYARCQFMTLHLWYHGGQLNYIQTLLGDDQWHWL